MLAPILPYAFARPPICVGALVLDELYAVDRRKVSQRKQAYP